MDFNEVLRFVRSYRNGHGDPALYDVNGVLHLMLAALDNLADHKIPADIEQIAESATSQQRRMLIAIGRLLAESESNCEN
ncbi:hypothetical protein CDL60_04515 [Roseateles noduli]|nr:hypothetical protein CDL60_04515 [Roseateles noduli]